MGVTQGEINVGDTPKKKIICLWHQENHLRPWAPISLEVSQDRKLESQVVYGSHERRAEKKGTAH